MWTLEHTDIGRILIPPHLPPGFAVFCTTRDYPGKIVAGELTSLVRQRFGIDTSLTTCLQIHSATVMRAGCEGSWRECDSCDALWSDERGVSIGIKVADCLPVTMLDPPNSVIANVHSGWRGAVQGITAATLDTLERNSTFDARQSFAYLGPSIRVCCFEVGEEVAERFDGRYVDRSRSRPHVDVPALTIDLLRSRGFDDAHIFDSALCTRCEGSIFHSYRRDREARGRNLVIAAQ